MPTKTRKPQSDILATVHASATGLHEAGLIDQAVFSRYLNVRKDAVSKWEGGEKRPDGPSLKLLNLVRAKGLQVIA